MWPTQENNAMKSSFKKGYERTVRQDGSVELSFTSQLIHGDKNNRGLAVLLVVPALLASCGVSDTFGLQRNREAGSVVLTMLMIAGALWLAAYLGMNWLLRRRQSITVVPHVGLRFGSKQLTFSDVQSVGVIERPSNGQGDPTSYLYANSRGQSIKLSGYIPSSVAMAVRNEIAALSGLHLKG